MTSAAIDRVSVASSVLAPPPRDRSPVRDGQSLPQGLTVTTQQSAVRAASTAAVIIVDQERSVSQERRSEGSFSDKDEADGKESETSLGSRSGRTASKNDSGKVDLVA